MRWCRALGAIAQLLGRRAPLEVLDRRDAPAPRHRLGHRPKPGPAMQFDGTPSSARLLLAFSGLSGMPGPIGYQLPLATASGRIDMRQGDWLLREPRTGALQLITNEQYFRDFDPVGARREPEPA